MDPIVSRRKFLTTAAGASAATALPISLASAATTPAAASTASTATTASAGAAAQPTSLADTTGYVQPTGEGKLVIATLEDLEERAAEVIPAGAFAYISAGADNQVTLRQNRAALDRIQLLPQYLVSKPAPDLSTTLLGHKLSMPVITSPMGAHGLAHKSAELGSAKGTSDAGTLYTAATPSNETLEDIAAASTGPKWFQLYLQDDRELSRDLLRRAKAAGYTAIVFTIDAFAPGASDDTIRLGFSFPPSLPLVNNKSGLFKSSLGWDDVDFIQDNTDLPLILKGVVTAEIAEEAIRRGVAAVQVSNHGGRGLDGMPGAIDLLPGVVKAVNGRVPVLMDSGIRRGTDVFKALALGADAVALGRPVLYGLALGGSQGVTSVYERLGAELSRAMMIAGVSTIEEIDNKYLYQPDTEQKA